MFNGSGEVGVEEADCAASVGHAVKWDRGGSQPAQDGGRGGEERREWSAVFRESIQSRTANQDVCKQEAITKNHTAAL